MRDEAELRTAYVSRIPLLEQTKVALERETERALTGVPRIDRITFRVKDIDRFITKAMDPRTEPPYENPLIEIEDQIAGRVIVFFLQDIDQVIERLEGTFNKVEQKYKRPSRMRSSVTRVITSSV